MFRGLGFLSGALLFFSGLSIHPMLILIPMVLFNAVMQAHFTPAVMSYLLDINLYVKERDEREPGATEQHVGDQDGRKTGTRRRGIFSRPDWFSLRTAAAHLASLAGQGAGSVLSGILGMGWLLLISGAGFLFSGVWERAGTDAPRSAAFSSHRDIEQKSFLSGIGGHMRRLHGFHRRGVPVYLYLGLQGVNSMLVVNMPFFLLRRLGAPEMYLGFAMASLFGGSLLYAALDSVILSGTRAAKGGAGIPALLYGVLLFLLSLFPAGFLDVEGIVLRGLIPVLLLVVSGGLLSAVYLNTLRQLHAKSTDQGSARYLGLLEAMGTAVLPVSYLVNSFIAGLLPLDTPWLLRSAAGVLLVGILVLAIRRKRSDFGENHPAR